MSTFYLPPPIYYVNARPHLGHACTPIMADAMCRYRRLRGDRVFFLTGTDEHGERIAPVAAAAGKSPQAYAGEIAGAYRETWRRLGITNDDFIRTTEPRHKKVVQEVLERLYDDAETYVVEEIVKHTLSHHGVYCMRMLKAAGIQLYRWLHVHGYWSLGGSKMSKSVGNVVEAFQLTDKYGHDAFRYFLLREMNFGLDASFSEEAFVDRLNADLANDLGNLASRASTLIAATGPVAQVTAPVEAADREIAIAAAEARATLEQAMEEFAFQKALGGIWAFIGAVNRYVDTSAPWALAKDAAKRPRLERVLCTLADSLGFLGVVLEPFLPDAARKIREAIGAPGPPALEAAGVGRLGSGPRVTKISGLFPRVDSKSPHPGPLPRGERESRTLSPLGRGQGEGIKGEGLKGEG